VRAGNPNQKRTEKMQARRDRLLAILREVGEATVAEIAKANGTSYNIATTDTDALLRAGRITRIITGKREPKFQLADRLPLLCSVYPTPKLPAYDRSRVVRFDDRHPAHREPRAAAAWTGYSSSLDVQHLASW
jgi:predicted transcriptional regulator